MVPPLHEEADETVFMCIAHEIKFKEVNSMRTNLFKRLAALVLVAAMCAGIMGMAFAWEPQWEHDEDLSAYKLCENPGDITLRVAVTDHASISTWEDNAFIKWLEEVTNVNLEFELLPYESRAEKLGLLLNSGSYPDMFIGSGMTDAMISRFGVTEKMFLPLNDLIAEHGNFIKKVFENYPSAMARITELDGNVYGLPNVNECYHCTGQYKFWLNQTWLDNLGLKQPATLDELREVLTAFKEKDANGNGDPSDEIPLAGDYADGWNTNPDRFIMSAFTYYSLNLKKSAVSSPEAFGMYLEDGKVVTPFALDAFKKGVKYVADMVKDGLIYEGSFTQDLAALTNIAESGRLGASGGGYICFANLGGDIYHQYRPLLPVTGPDGQRNLYSYPHGTVERNAVIISAETKYPVECFKLADLFYTYAASMRSYYGVYGEQWTDADKDALGINGEPALYKLLQAWDESKPQAYCVLQMVPSYRDARYRLGEPSPAELDLYSKDGLEKLLYQVTKEYKEYVQDEKVVPPMKFTDEENEEMSVLKTNLSNLIKEGMFAFFTGAKDVDTEFDAWVESLEANGLSQLVEYYQKAYDAQYSK